MITIPHTISASWAGGIHSSLTASCPHPLYPFAFILVVRATNNKTINNSCKEHVCRTSIIMQINYSTRQCKVRAWHCSMRPLHFAQRPQEVPGAPAALARLSRLSCAPRRASSLCACNSCSVTAERKRLVSLCSRCSLLVNVSTCAVQGISASVDTNDAARLMQYGSLT